MPAAGNSTTVDQGCGAELPDRVTAISLLLGLSVNPPTCLISGTRTIQGLFQLTVKVTDSSGVLKSATF